jgi:hypothetical protein
MRYLTALLLVFLVGSGGFAQTFDHGYRGYGDLLRRYVKGTRVDYRGLAADRAALQAVVGAFGNVPSEAEGSWTPDERLAFWINAYNLFTLDAIVSRYPIKARLFTMQPRNSIRQIDGVWTTLEWKAAGRDVTLDGIEHGIIRKEFRQPLIHFAVNCASISCPPLRAEPYVGSNLRQQLEDSARRYLASPEGARLDGSALRVSSIFKWYGEDFTSVVGFLRTYGPPDVAKRAAEPGARVSYLPYNWSLNDVGPSS